MEQQNQMMYEIMNKLGELVHKVEQLERENQDLKLNIIAMSPVYSEEQRRNAIEQINARMAVEEHRSVSAFH